MKLAPDALDAHLAQKLAPVYLVSGDEPLVVNESADAIRARARRDGFVERDVHFIERGVSWDDIRSAASTLSLFATRRLIELRMPSGKPGVTGGATLVDLVRRADPDVLFLVLTEKLERESQNAAWVREIESHGVWVQVWPIDAGRMPTWIRARARRSGLDLDDAGAKLLAERTEGNLLAAHQEIERLALLLGERRANAQDVMDTVADSARFDVFKLGEAALQGDATRALRIVAGLHAEGVEPTLVLWSLLRELRSVWSRGQSGGRAGGGYGRPSPGLDRAVRRFTRDDFAPLIERASRADRMIKGQLRGNAWDELTLLTAQMCHVNALRTPHAAT